MFKTNKNLALFSKRIVELAGEQGARSIDLFHAIGCSADVASPAMTENGVHYGDAGYRMIARHVVKGLGWKENAEGAEALRLAVIQKNRLFFHRWRPANETYLFLFRQARAGKQRKRNSHVRSDD